ncbi:MAG: hypothetical protein ACMXYA_00010 [Candidatus Woesearchaeota archaeon]
MSEILRKNIRKSPSMRRGNKYSPVHNIDSLIYGSRNDWRKNLLRSAYEKLCSQEDQVQNDDLSDLVKSITPNSERNTQKEDDLLSTTQYVFNLQGIQKRNKGLKNLQKKISNYVQADPESAKSTLDKISQLYTSTGSPDSIFRKTTRGFQSHLDSLVSQNKPMKDESYSSENISTQKKDDAQSENSTKSLDKEKDLLSTTQYVFNLQGIQKRKRGLKNLQKKISNYVESDPENAKSTLEKISQLYTSAGSPDSIFRKTTRGFQSHLDSLVSQYTLMEDTTKISEEHNSETNLSNETRNEPSIPKKPQREPKNIGNLVGFKLQGNEEWEQLEFDFMKDMYTKKQEDIPYNPQSKPQKKSFWTKGKKMVALGLLSLGLLYTGSQCSKEQEETHPYNIANIKEKLAESETSAKTPMVWSGPFFSSSIEDPVQDYISTVRSKTPLVVAGPADSYQKVSEDKSKDTIPEYFTDVTFTVDPLKRNILGEDGVMFTRGTEPDLGEYVVTDNTRSFEHSVDFLDSIRPVYDRFFTTYDNGENLVLGQRLPRVLSEDHMSSIGHNIRQGFEHVVPSTYRVHDITQKDFDEDLIYSASELLGITPEKALSTYNWSTSLQNRGNIQ